MTLVKEHTFLSIHTEGVWLVPLINICTRDIFGLDLDLLYPLSYINQYFFTLYIIIQIFMKKYIIYWQKEIYWCWWEWYFSKKKVWKLQNAKYHVTYANQNYVLERYYIKNTRIRRVYSGRKRKATDFVYLQGSPYRDAEGSSQLISCLHDSIMNAAPIIEGGWQTGIVYIVSTKKGEVHTNNRVGKMRMCIIYHDPNAYIENCGKTTGSMGFILIIDDGLYVCICNIYSSIFK